MGLEPPLKVEEKMLHLKIYILNYIIIKTKNNNHKKNNFKIKKKKLSFFYFFRFFKF